MLGLKSVLLHVVTLILMLGLTVSGLAVILSGNGNTTPFWILMAVFVMGLIIVRQAYRHLK